MRPPNRSVSTKRGSRANSGYVPRFEPLYTRVDNGLYLVNNGPKGLDLKFAKDIHLASPHALVHEYEFNFMPHGLRLYTMQTMRHIHYTVCEADNVVFRARYQLDADELTDVRTHPDYRNRGIARAVLAIILRADGPKTIRAHPSVDSPLTRNKLIRFYSSFQGYHAISGTNKVIRLMQDTMIEEAGANDFGRTRPKSALELSVLEQNSRELKRIMGILQPINDAEIDGLLKAQETDMLSLRNAMQIYNEEFFASRPWGRAHRVIFAQSMADLLFKNAGMRCSVWDKIIADESF